MVDQIPGDFEPARSSRVDTALRWIIILLGAAVIGAVLLFGYTLWQGDTAEKSATPAQRALQQYEDFVRGEPNNVGGRVRYGEALAAAGLFEEAVEQFKAAVKIDDKHSGAWLDLGLVSMRTDEQNAAERYFTKVVELTEGQQYEKINQRREQALFHLGEIALDERRYDDAVAFFKSAIRIRKDASDSYYLLAQALVGMGDDKAALGQLDAALAFDPNYAEAHYLYGKIYLDQGDRINAAVHLALASKLAPNQKQPKEALKKLPSYDEAFETATSALQAKRYDEALENAMIARGLEPGNVKPVVLHARVLLAQKNLKAAKAVVAEAEKMAPQDAEVKEVRKTIGK